MGNSNTGASIERSTDIKESTLEGFETRWKCFLDSLDVSAGNLKNIESLDSQKKQELLLNFEAKTHRTAVSEHVNFLKKFDWETLIAGRRKEDGVQLRSLLSSTEISLRTSSVEWVYEFLSCEGLELLSDFMSAALDILYSFHNHNRSLGRSHSQNPEHRRGSDRGRSSAIRRLHSSPHSRDIDRRLFAIEGDNLHQSLPSNLRELIKDCLHLSLRCMKTILNNQVGCQRALAYTRVISLLAFSLVHPNFATKALALDILSALCLIEGGHSKVLQAFDRLRVLLSEGLRFELLLTALQHHETLDVDSYCLEFSVACVQFFNIVVHSPENINLRVYLQHELYLLGLDDLLKKLGDSVDARLRLHVDAYLDNRVDCSLLLEDAEAKEAAVLEIAQIQASWTKKLDEVQASFKHREGELSEQVESLRNRIQSLNTSVWDRENANKRQLTELQAALNVAHSDISQLKSTISSLKLETCANSSLQTKAVASIDGGGDVCRQSVGESGVASQNILPKSDQRVNLNPTQSSAEDAARNQLKQIYSNQLCSSESANLQTFVVPDGLTEQSTLVRRLASEAASGLSRLINQTTSSSTVIPLVPPVGWLSQHNDTQIANAYCLFSEAVTNKNLSILLSGAAVASREDTVRLSGLVTGRQQIHPGHLPYPWGSVVQQINSCHPHMHAMDESLNWLIEVNLVPTDVEDILRSPELSTDRAQSSPSHWNLFHQLSTCSMTTSLAQRLLCQLKSSDLNQSTGSVHSLLTRLLDQLELDLTRHFGSLRHPVWSLSGEHENRWFWTSALLRICLLKSMWPRELQHVVEALSALLSGCVSVLVSTKLPLVMKLALHLANCAMADCSIRCFRLHCLDSLIDWQLAISDCNRSQQSSSTNPLSTANCAASRQPKSVSFVFALASLIQQATPCLLDWPSDLVQTDTASRVRIEVIRTRLTHLRLLVDIWLAIGPNTSVSIATEQETTANQVYQQLGDLNQSLDSVGLVVIFTRRWLMATLDQDSCSQWDSDWMAPLVRFSNAFTRAAASLEKQPHHLPSSTVNDSLEHPSSTVGQPSQHHRDQHRSKAEKLQNNGGDRREHRHRKHKTRQLDADGIVDDILAGLTLSPLRADLHVNRKDE